MRAVKKWCFDLKSNLRAKCFVIGYWHLIAALVSTVLHLLVVFILTDGFRCETSKESLRAVQWSWLSPVLLITNMGAHGFYAYPLILNYHINPSITYLPIPEDNAPCFSVMSVVTANDIMYFLFNILWMVFVLFFIIAVHEKDISQMIVFLLATSCKLCVQLRGIFQMSSFDNALMDIIYKILDICIIVIFLLIIWNCIKKLKTDKNRKQPGFIENLLTALKKQDEIQRGPVFAIYNEKQIPPVEEKNGSVDVKSFSAL